MTPEERIGYIIDKARQYGMEYKDGQTALSMAYIIELIQRIETDKRTKGKWKTVGYNQLGVPCLSCNLCNSRKFYTESYKFCPDCGADMRGTNIE